MYKCILSSVYHSTRVHVALGHSLKSFDHKTNIHKVHMQGFLESLQSRPPCVLGVPDLGVLEGPDTLLQGPGSTPGGIGEGVEPGGGTVLKVSGAP